MIDSNRWRIGREIPLTVILTLIFQTVGFVWWLGSLSAKVDETLRATVKLEAQFATLSGFATQQALSAAKIAGLESEVERLRVKLDLLQQEQQRRAPFPR